MFTPDTPGTQYFFWNSPPGNKTIDKYRIHRLDHHFGDKIRVTIQRGYLEASVFIKGSQGQYDFSGSILSTKVAELVTNGATYEASWEKAIWTLLQEQNKVGAGTIS